MKSKKGQHLMKASLASVLALTIATPLAGNVDASETDDWEDGNQEVAPDKDESHSVGNPEDNVQFPDWYDEDAIYEDNGTLVYTGEEANHYRSVLQTVLANPNQYYMGDGVYEVFYDIDEDGYSINYEVGNKVIPSDFVILEMTLDEIVVIGRDIPQERPDIPEGGTDDDSDEVVVLPTDPEQEVEEGEYPEEPPVEEEPSVEEEPTESSEIDEYIYENIISISLDGMTVNITEILGDDFEEELKAHLEWFAEEFELDFNIENKNVTSEVTEIINENGKNLSKTTREISVSLSSIPAELPELNEDTVPTEVNTTTLNYKVGDNIHKIFSKEYDVSIAYGYQTDVMGIESLPPGISLNRIGAGGNPKSVSYILSGEAVEEGSYEVSYYVFNRENEEYFIENIILDIEGEDSLEELPVDEDEDSHVEDETDGEDSDDHSEDELVDEPTEEEPTEEDPVDEPTEEEPTEEEPVDEPTEEEPTEEEPTEEEPTEEEPVDEPTEEEPTEEEPVDEPTEEEPTEEEPVDEPTEEEPTEEDPVDEPTEEEPTEEEPVDEPTEEEPTEEEPVDEPTEEEPTEEEPVDEPTEEKPTEEEPVDEPTEEEPTEEEPVDEPTEEEPTEEEPVDEPTEEEPTEEEPVDEPTEEEATEEEPVDEPTEEEATEEEPVDESGEEEVTENYDFTEVPPTSEVDTEVDEDSDVSSDGSDAGEQEENESETIIEESSVVDEASGITVSSASGELEGVQLVVEVLEGSELISNPHDLYDIELLDADGNEYEPEAPVTVSIPANDRVTNVYYLGESGETLTELAYEVVDGYVVFTTDSFSQFAVEYDEMPEEVAEDDTVDPATDDDVVVTEVNADGTSGGETASGSEAAESDETSADTTVAAAEKNDTEQEMLPDTGIAAKNVAIPAVLLIALGGAVIYFTRRRPN